MTIVFNNEWTACPTLVTTDHSFVVVDPFKAYGTEYGMFIPTDYTAGSWLKWIKAGMPALSLGDFNHYGSFVHITNDGDMYTVTFDAHSGDVIQFQHTSKQFGACNGSSKYFISAAALIEKCETITQCIDILEKRTVIPMAKPLIINVSDWVEYAKKNGYNKHFFLTKWTS